MIRLSKSVLSEADFQAVDQVLRREFLGMGPEVREFENELATYISGDVQVVCVNTGTAALHLAAQAIGLKTGDEVLIPSLTYVASFQAIQATGATPIPCDVNLETGLLDLDSAQSKLTRNTKALMPVHYASYPGDLNSYYQFAEKHGLRVIEDAAHAFGCLYRGLRIGSFGDVVCFSFDGIKNITAGEGGAVVTKDRTVVEKVKDARLLGVQNDSEARYRGERSWSFDVVEQGWRYHMSDIMAALGRSQLKRFERDLKPVRVRMAKAYRENLSDCEQIKLFQTNPEEVVPHIMPIRIQNGKKTEVQNALKDADIQTGVHYVPNHLLSLFGSGRPRLPNSELLFGELLTLPLHPDVTETQVKKICEIIRTTLKRG